MRRTQIIALLLPVIAVGALWIVCRGSPDEPAPDTDQPAVAGDGRAPPRAHDAPEAPAPEPVEPTAEDPPQRTEPEPEGGNPWDPDTPTDWLPADLSDDPGPDRILLGLLHHPERPPMDEDALEPAQDELVLYVLLEDRREIWCRITFYFDLGDGRGLREITRWGDDCSKEHPSLPRLTRAGVFFETDATLKRGQVAEATVTTRDPSGAGVRDYLVRYEVP